MFKAIIKFFSGPQLHVPAVEFNPSAVRQALYADFENSLNKARAIEADFRSLSESNANLIARLEGTPVTTRPETRVI